MAFSFWKIAFRIVLAIIIGTLVGLLFRSVMPPTAAYVLAIIVAVVELAGSLATAQAGAGHGIRLMLRMGEVLLAWPIAAWVLTWVGLSDRGVRIGLAAAIASAVGMGAARHGYGRDSARLITVAIACAIPVYAVFTAVLSGDGRAVIAGCVAAAVAPLTAGVAHVWPDAHHGRLTAASVVCVTAAALVLARVLVF